MTKQLPYGCSTAQILRNQVVVGFALTDILYTPYLKLPRHAHARACFSFVLRGGFTESCGKKTHSCLPASIIYLPPGEAHSDDFHSTGARCLHIELSSELVSRLDEHSVSLGEPLVFNGRTLTHLTTKLCNELNQPDSVSPLAVEALALELVVESTRGTSKTLDGGPRYQVERARDFIHEHFAEQITLTRIAEAIDAHHVYLARQFHRHFRCTVGEYVRRLRIEFACRRLLDSDDSLASIALSAGFFDQSHFSRTFKLFMSISPAKYRRTFRHS